MVVLRLLLLWWNTNSHGAVGLTQPSVPHFETKTSDLLLLRLLLLLQLLSATSTTMRSCDVMLLWLLLMST